MAHPPLPSSAHHLRLILVATLGTIGPLVLLAPLPGGMTPAAPVVGSESVGSETETQPPSTVLHWLTSKVAQIAPTPPDVAPASAPLGPPEQEEISPSPRQAAPINPATEPPPERDRLLFAPESSEFGEPIDPDTLFRTPNPAPRPTTRPPAPPPPIDPTRAGVPLTLDEAVALAVLHNTEVRNRYLDRIVERASLRTAAAELLPKLTPTLITGLVDRGGGQGTNTEVNAQLSWFAPTGGTLAVDWRSQLNGFRNDDASQGLTITYRHPLNRYGESALAYRNRERSLIQEDINLLNLRETLNRTITATIERYRDLILAQEQVTLTVASLDNARRQLARQQALVEAGRAARFTLLRTEQNVAAFQSELLQSENAVQSARLALMNQVGVDRDLPVVAIAASDAIATEPVQLNPQQLIAVSLAQRPDYLIDLLALNLAGFDLQEADHARRWQLNLETRYADATGEPSDFSAQLVLTQPLGERTRRQEAFDRSRVARLQRQNNLSQREADIRIAVQNQVRQVRLQFEQLQIARQRVELATQELAAQEALTQAGLGDAFQLQDAQRELLTVRTGELTQRVSYSNALTALDEIQGITLERWGIQLDPAR